MLTFEPIWPDHTIAAPQPFVSLDFEDMAGMIEHLAETVVMPVLPAEPIDREEG